MNGRLSTRWVWLALVAVLAATNAAMAQTRTVTFMHWGGESYVARYERLIADFEMRNPGIKIERIGGGSGQEYDDTLLTRIAGGVAPDVYIVDMQYVARYAPMVHDLRPLAERDPDFKLDELAPVIIDVFTADGKLIAFPHDVSPNLYFYNADMFEEAGLELPTLTWRRDAWTWATFRDAARKLHRTDADRRVTVWGTLAGTGQSLPRLFMWSNGAAEFDDVLKPTKALHDHPDAIEALDFLQQLHIADGVAVPVGQNASFPAGEVAMFARWSSGIAAFAAAPFKWGLAPYPKGPGPNGRYASDIGTAGFVIHETAADVEAAWKFVSYLAGPHAAVIIGEMGPGIPVRPGAEITNFPENLLYPEAVYEIAALPDKGNHIRLLSKDQADINNILTEEIDKILAGAVPAASGASELVRRVATFLANNPQ